MIFRNKEAVSAEKPPVSAPARLDSMTRRKELPNPITVLTRNESTPSFDPLIFRMSSIHKRKSPKKPPINELRGVWGMAMATINAAMEIDHHGKYNPEAKASNAVSNTDMMNFMRIRMDLILGDL